MAYFKTKETIDKDIFYVPCLKCGSENIDFNDCNYSSFNMCYGRCKDCGHESSCGCDISPSKESIIDFWNMNNDIDYIIKNKMYITLSFEKSYLLIGLYFQTFFFKNKTLVLGLNLFSELLNIAAKLLANFASLLAPLALVWVVNGFQPLIVFI